MLVEIINTGSELMLGRVLNTHQQWLCQQFANLGHVVTRQIAVADTAVDIQAAVRESLARCDLVVATGGLGPTSDDLTRDLIAQLLGKTLRRDEAVLERIKSYFVGRSRPMPESVTVQALVPDGAIVLPNEYGTAPGLAIKVSGAECQRSGSFSPDTPHLKPRTDQWLVMLPGPPRELRPMFVNFVVPLLKKNLPETTRFVCRTLRSFGMGESSVEERIVRDLQSSFNAGLEIGYCARPEQVDVRLAARGKEAEKIVGVAEEIVREKLGSHIFGLDDDTLESVVVRLLTEKRQTLTLAESCTGGAIANRITNVPGASTVFLGGFVTYANELKQKFLGVTATALAAHGAVSEPVAREMAEGARQAAHADFALAVTGIAGPSGGSKEKPVGTVFIALASPKKTEVWKMFNPWERETFKEITAQQALNFLRLKLVKEVSSDF